MSRSKLLLNKYRCKTCDTILESKSRHDFVSCPCGNFVDGGNSYSRIGGDFDNLEDLCEFEKDVK